MILRKYLLNSTFGLLVFASAASADPLSLRWEQRPELTDDLTKIVAVIDAENSAKLSASDFVLKEKIDMAQFRVSTYVQVSQGVPVQNAVLRVWLSTSGSGLVQMEADLQPELAQSLIQTSAAVQELQTAFFNLKIKKEFFPTVDFATKVVKHSSEDPTVRGITSSDEWVGTDLQRVITVRGKRGFHTIRVSIKNSRLIEATYRQFPQEDVAAKVFPIYEETKSLRMQKQVPVMLRNLLPQRRVLNSDPTAPLRIADKPYLTSKHDEDLGKTEAGRAAGYWSLEWMKSVMDGVINQSPLIDNTFAGGGVALVGKYITVNFQPGVEKLPGILVPPTFSEQLQTTYKEVPDSSPTDYVITPVAALRGQPLANADSALNRPARRLPDHDVVTYVNDGFDEVQVYYAVNQLMESLQGMGFTDPELSTRPFNAFLYNLDVEYKNNAYYDSDTINFTTYSPDQVNYARDNPTIWHELGHGVMDRLMGPYLRLADSGGLSEGMADFVAALVIQDVSKGERFDGDDEFRIINKTGFSLTNEEHDDGESYGGAMKDIMDSAIAKFGRAGLVKMTDLTLSAMRLTRNYPGMNANIWFNHMLYADRLGNLPLRAPGEMGAVVVQALNNRNFRMDGGPVAKLKILVGEEELTNKTKGSRYNPYIHTLKPGEEASYTVDVSLQSSEAYQFKYPVTLKVLYNDWALQGALNWKDEAAGPQVFTLNSEADHVQVKLTALPGCQFSNREDGGCSDYAYFRVFNNGESFSVAKKRFYIRLKP